MTVARTEAARLLIGHETTEVLAAAAGRALTPPGMAPAASGAGVHADCAGGVLCVNPAEAMSAAASGIPYVYARLSTVAADLETMAAAAAVVTAVGGVTSHAAVLARSWRIPTVVGTGFRFSGSALLFPAGARLRPGDWVTVCATSGSVWPGQLEQYRDPSAVRVLSALTEAASQLTDLPGPDLYANADTAEEIRTCLGLGAQGIGVARTEHMFLAEAELGLLRAALWPGPGSADQALTTLQERLRVRCRDLEAACAGRKLVIRLLDPPTHEFSDDRHNVESVETNPMMGVRGSRLGLLRPDIYRMQTAAIVAAHQSLPEHRRAQLGILLPFVTYRAELRQLRRELAIPAGVQLGVMVETPEAAHRTGELAEDADFLSVGTNDLLQFCLAMSRDDVAAELIPAYLAAAVVPGDPMVRIEESASAMELLRLVRDRSGSTPWGICGEHAGDPIALRSLLALGPDYISVSAGGLAGAAIEIGRHRAALLLEPAGVGTPGA
ncbi:PEP-utilizing enzyme [Actinoplanes sp. NEAU-A12]|uniref:Pyruvate, phosphate dikinase n=1 Tax=Actinoplanes sandaracinus TaxID=3045177 RepID=A0ABT6WRB7_9ACTN|nr:putative PEP-binding protein [Actinoplanes sandaracinus]MDI6102278.1 PEP-utilizing enzyme [Actinoplanes sandaracinus]